MSPTPLRDRQSDHSFYAMIRILDTERPGKHWHVIAAGFIALHFSCASAQQVPTDSASVPASVSERYPAGSIKSVETADAALAEVGRERAEIEARFAVEEHACHPKFFATSCVDEARERRRQALSQLRNVELEANAFKRRERVAEREKAAADRLAKEEADRQERVREQREVQGVDSASQERAEAAKAQGRASPDREAEHAARLKHLEEKDRADAPKRAENMAEYERKVRAAEERQRKVAQRKAEREAERKAKQAPEAGTQ